MLALSGENAKGIFKIFLGDACSDFCPSQNRQLRCGLEFEQQDPSAKSAVRPAPRDGEKTSSLNAVWNFRELTIEWETDGNGATELTADFWYEWPIPRATGAEQTAKYAKYANEKSEIPFRVFSVFRGYRSHPDLHFPSCFQAKKRVRAPIASFGIKKPLQTKGQIAVEK